MKTEDQVQQPPPPSIHPLAAPVAPSFFQHLGHTQRFTLEDDSLARHQFLTRGKDKWREETKDEMRLQQHINEMHMALSANHTSRVFELFQALKQDAQVQNLHVEVFNVLLKACGILKQPEAAVATYDSIFLHRSIRPDFFTYVHLIDALLDHHDPTLAFDFLVLLHREFDSALFDAQERSLSSSHIHSCAVFMHTHLIELHRRFLERLSHLGKGYKGTKETQPEVRKMEEFIKAYLQQHVRLLKEELRLVPSNNPPPPPQHASAIFQYYAWEKLNLVLQTLFHHAIQRRDLATATSLWQDLDSVRQPSPDNQAFLDHELELDSEVYMMRGYATILGSLSAIHHAVEELPQPDEDRLIDMVAKYHSDRARRSAGVGEEEQESWPVEKWHAIRTRVYKEFWAYLRKLLRAKQAVLTGMSRSDASSEYLKGTTGAEKRHSRPSPGAEKEELTDLLPASQYVARVREHEKEEPALEDLTPRQDSPLLGATPGRLLGKDAKRQGKLDQGEPTSIDALVDALHEQNLALQLERASPEQAFKQIEDEARKSSGVQRKGELEKRVKERAEEMWSEAENNESALTPEELHRIAESKDRRMPSAPQRRAKKLVVPPRPDAGPSLLPPIERSLWSAATTRKLHFIYQTLVGNLLVFGGSTVSGRVTPGGYRRNQELIHALYYDYLALDLPNISSRVMMLAHISHAPPEFHVSILQDSDWISARNTGGLVQTLFSPFLIQPPTRFRTSSTPLEAQMERLEWFRKRWVIHHVHPWSVAARGSDLAFRKRTYQLIEELGRRGIPLQGQKDGLLHFLIRCLTFTSYASRPEGLELLEKSFHWRRQNLYEGHIIHIRRVLRVLFGMMLHQGVHPTTRVMNELISSCLKHHRLAEAHSILQYMRQVFHLLPDHTTMNLFLDEKYTPKHTMIAQRMLMELDANMNEIITNDHDATGGKSRGKKQNKKYESELKARDSIDEPLTTSHQLLDSFNQLLNQYVIAQDSGAGMLRVHERIFDLGLHPDGRTLALSLAILLQTPNSVSLARARELFSHALEKEPKEVTRDGALAQFIEQMEAGRVEAKDLERQRIERLKQEKKEREAEVAQVFETDPNSPTSAKESDAASVATSPAAPVEPEIHTVLEDLTFDPLSSPVASNYAIPFSYSSWYGIYVTTRSWLVLIEGAEGLGSWVDCWSIFFQYMQHLASLPPTDRRWKMYLNQDRLTMFASVLRTLVHHTSHLEPHFQLWYFKQVYGFMTQFYSIALVTRVDATGKSTTAPTSSNFSLDESELRWILLPFELAQLQKWEQLVMRGYRIATPSDESDQLVEHTMRALQARRTKQQPELEGSAQKLLEPSPRARNTRNTEDTMAFL